MPTARVHDINIYYEARGEGEPLLLIMGLGGGSSMWWHQVEAFSEEHRVVTFDYRGVGRSDKPDIPYSVEMLVGDTVGLLESLEIGSAHIYGLSMGGMIAQEIALRRPEMVTSLILGATSCGGSHAIAPSHETLQALFGSLTLPPAEAASAVASLIFSPAFIESSPGQIKEMMARGMESPPSPHGFRRQAEAIAGFDSYDRLGEISVPTLVIAGTEDRLLPFENSRVLASRIPDAELALLDGAGHGYIWEVADEADRIVLQFLRRHRGQA